MSTKGWLADSIREMACGIGSLRFHSSTARSRRALKGENPFEAVALGSCILHGPEISHFAESYRGLGEAGGAIQVADADELAGKAVMLQSPASRKSLLKGAARVAAGRRGVLDATWAAIREAVS